MSQTLPLIFLSCEVFKGIVDTNKIPESNSRVQFLDAGLHATPKKLHSTVQEQINSIVKPSVIVLGYGLCGNGLNEIHSGLHTLIIPKMDDCIAMFMGGRKAFMDEFNANPGTYYLTKGWLQAKTHPLAEFKGYVEKYGEETAYYLMDQQYQHYSRLVFAAHSQEDLDKYRPIANEVAEFCKRWDMKFEEYLGGTDFIQELEESLRNPDQIPESFIMVSPGEILKQEMFR